MLLVNGSKYDHLHSNANVLEMHVFLLFHVLVNGSKYVA